MRGVRSAAAAAFLSALAAVLLPGLSLAQAPQIPATELFRSFDPGPFTETELRFLQTALAFAGDYNGLIDGAWGQRSQRALEAWSRRESGDAPEGWHVALLALDLLDRIDREGWQVRDMPVRGQSMLFPARAAIPEPRSGDLTNWQVAGSSLRISHTAGGFDRAAFLHDANLARASAREEPYTLRREGLGITHVVTAEGTSVYVRSDRIAGVWHTTILSSAPRDRAALQAVAGSIRPMPARALFLPPAGEVQRTIEALAAVVAAENAPAPPAPRSPSTPTEVSPSAPAPALPPGGASGSGFVVSADGHILTNAHVVEDCKVIRVDGRPARVVDRDETLDLALVSTGLPRSAVARFSSSPAPLNADVTVAGFPHSRLLGGLNVTRGSVSATLGLLGDVTQLQITAPVQAGNSGGPVLAQDGSVLGVVVGKLDAAKVAEVTGDLPQNVNFAIRGEVAQLFLYRNGIAPLPAAAVPAVDPVKLAQIASEFTVFVECE